MKCETCTVTHSPLEVDMRCFEKWTREAELLAGNGSPRNRFGCSVSVCGDVCVVGAENDGDWEEGLWSGAAYIFRRDGDGAWALESRLRAQDAAAFDRLGHAVSLSGTSCLVGAHRNRAGDVTCGSAYIFRRTDDGTWDQEAKLVSPAREADGSFGEAVALSGDLCVVGAPGQRSGRGAAYVFRRSQDGTWTLETQLAARGLLGTGHFGASVSLLAGSCVVGAPDDNGGRGAVYVYRRSIDGTWADEEKLQAVGGTPFSQLGHSVSVSDYLCVAGADFDDSVGVCVGCAYAFRRASNGTWEQEGILLPASNSTMRRFGWSISLSGSLCAVGAKHDQARGSVRLYDRGVDGYWVPQGQLPQPETEPWPLFSRSVSLSGDLCVVGSVDISDWHGAAHVFIWEGE